MSVYQGSSSNQAQHWETGLFMWVFSFLISVPIVSLSFCHLRECHDTSSDSDHKFRKPLCCLQFKYYSLWPQHTIAPPPCHMCHYHLSSDTTFFTSSDVSLPPELRVRAQAQIMVVLSGPGRLPIPQALAPTFVLASRPRASRCNSAATLTYHVLIAVPGSGTHLGGCCGHCPPLIHSVNIYLGEDP